MEKERIIMGIDPGTNIMGFGVIKVVGRTMSFVAMDELDMRKLDDPFLKLQHIYKATTRLIDTYLPDEIALEAPFYGKNVQSMLKLGRAQGVAMAAGLMRDIPITEYLPKRVKMAITGNGNASKEQVAGMLVQLLHFKEIPHHMDSTDALGIAVCHFFNTGKTDTKSASYSGWKSFVSQNQDRITGSLPADIKKKTLKSLLEDTKLKK
ncbi:MAG: crossover junction endodeoxyribonuclease RuvC [Flavobacteriales bacterium]|nr:crossover junction endodeoxyribonuclease RuvC [Flavobacteriales bacterium]